MTKKSTTLRDASRSRTALLLIALAFVCLIQYTLRHQFNHRESICSHGTCHHSQSQRIFRLADKRIKAHDETVSLFWKNFFAILQQHSPTCPAIVLTDVAQTKGATMVAARPRIINLSHEDLACLRMSHAGFHQASKQSFPQLPFIKGTRGIVTTVAGRYLRTVIISLRMLRRSGNFLPMEIFLSTREEIDPLLCNVVFPALNARCALLETVFDHHANMTSFHKFQYKSLAILSSTFEDVLFLDADNLVVNKVEELFDWDEYKRTGMVAWPDVWVSTASSDMTTIQGISPLHYWNRMTYESGQMVISKGKHGETLLLSAYYNLLGPNYYYPLLSQGAIGQGDKETFVAAAQADGKDFYVTQKAVESTGFYEGIHWWYSALIQWHPMDDVMIQFRRRRGNRWKRDISHRPLFVHASYPKLDAATIMNPLDDFIAVRYDNGRGKAHRLWDGLEKSELKTNLGNDDIEEVVWQELEAVACELGDKMNTWPRERDAKITCKLIQEHRKSLFGT